MAYAIVADYILGTYQGHDLNGKAEPFPSVTRLHAALISAAFSLASYEDEAGFEITLDGQSGVPLKYAGAIKWIEENPPDAIDLPRIMSNETNSTIAFRDKGLLKKSSKKRLAEHAVSHVALSGPLSWWWGNAPDGETAERLSSLVSEVSYLGETDSPVRILAYSTDEMPADAWRRADGDDIALLNLPATYVPELGRAGELQRIYLESHKPTHSQRSEAPGTDEKEIVDEYARECTRLVHYSRPIAANDDKPMPWNSGFLLRVESRDGAVWPPKENEYLTWAVALHRALVKCCGIDVPAMLSGKSRAAFDTLAVPPANCLAIQVIDSRVSAQMALPIDGAAFMVMIPSDAPEIEIEKIEAAINRLSSVYIQGSKIIRIAAKNGQKAIPMDLRHFWKKPPEGFARWWQPCPLFITDSRPPVPSLCGGKTWGVAEAIKVAVGYTWRDTLRPRQKGDRKLVELVNLADEKGVTVVGERVIALSHIQEYVHRTNKGALPAAGTALINLGSLGSDEALASIGQSRHLGGGLLVPVDIPDASARRNQNGPEEGAE